MSALIGEWDSLIPVAWPEGLKERVASVLSTFWAKNEDYQCVDNHRIARAGNPEEVSAYFEARKSGCCGQVDECWPMDETIVLYGFDHGH